MKIDGIKNFHLEEFIPKEIWKRWKTRSTRFIRLPLLELAQSVRDRYGKPVTINNWLWWKKGMKLYNYSGYRPPLCKVGAFLSRHKLGLAIDIKVDGMDAPEVQKDIVDNYESVFKPMGLTAIEQDTPTWTHMSIEWTLSDSLIIIPRPKKRSIIKRDTQSQPTEKK
jgi:hypothetical protein